MSEDVKHTPGPWLFRTDSRTGDNGIHADGTGIFAEAYAEIRCAGENNRDEALANAHLIISAPDLYEALKAYIAADDNTSNPAKSIREYDRNMERARTSALVAIAKAEGRS